MPSRAGGSNLKEIDSLAHIRRSLLLLLLDEHRADELIDARALVIVSDQIELLLDQFIFLHLCHELRASVHRLLRLILHLSQELHLLLESLSRCL